MSTPKKRKYSSESRKQQALKTKTLILKAAKKLIQSQGLENTTIEQIGLKAKVSPSSIYSIYSSKRGILLAIMDEALDPSIFDSLVQQGKEAKTTKEQFLITAKISRKLYDAEKSELSFLRGATVVDPMFKELELERENRRYGRQEEMVKKLFHNNEDNNEKLHKDYSFQQIRDLIWAFTGRDLYRMLVIERGWSSDEYENVLAKVLGFLVKK